MPSASNRSSPMSSFMPSRTKTSSASSIPQTLLSTGVCIMPMMSMGSFAKVLTFLEGSVVSHSAREELLKISIASDSLKILHRLPESMRRPTFGFPIFRVVFFGAVYVGYYSQYWPIFCNPNCCSPIHILGCSLCLE